MTLLSMPQSIRSAVTRMDRREREGLVLILLAVLGYSFFTVWVRGISASGLPELDMATWRFLFTVPIIWLLARARGERPSGGVPIPRVALLLTGPLMTVAALAAMIGLQTIPASVYLLLFYTYPALVALLSLLRGERIERTAWLALGITLVGAALTMPNLSEGLQQGANVQGVVLALVNAVAVAVYFVVQSHLLRGCTDTVRASAWSLTGTLIPLVVLLPFRPLQLPANLMVWFNLACLILVSTVLPVVMLNAGIQRLGAPRAAILGTTELVLALLWAVLILGDTITPVQVAGGVLIFFSIILLQIRQIRSPTPPPLIPGDHTVGL